MAKPSGNRYWWLKLNENFFQSDTIIWLENQKNGREYCYFYLKLLLLSLKTNGLLTQKIGTKIIPYDLSMLSEKTRTEIDTVTVAVKIFTKIGLIEIVDDRMLYMAQLAEMVGSETDYAASKRLARNEKRGDNVSPMSHQCLQNVRDNVRTEQEQDIIEQEQDVVAAAAAKMNIAEKTTKDFCRKYTTQKVKLALATLSSRDNVKNPAGLLMTMLRDGFSAAAAKPKPSAAAALTAADEEKEKIMMALAARKEAEK